MRLFSLLFCIIMLLCPGNIATAQDRDSMPFTIVEYNCENLFDCRHDSLKNDNEFLPDGERRWTPRRYKKKRNDIARVLHQCGGEGKAWRLPDAVALVEVENDSTLISLTRFSMLRNAGYRYVMTNSPDLRGIDVAFMYNPLTFHLTNHYPLRIKPAKDQRPTRDILYVKGLIRNGETMHIYVVHAPSRSGGRKQTEGYRTAVAERVISSIDSIRTTEKDANIIVLGDFNDYSNDKALKMLGEKDLIEISRDAVGKRKPKVVLGTYNFQNTWESLDHIFLSAGLASKTTECFIQDNEWMLEKSPNGDYKPFRTYLGPSYHGGISDHLPLVLRMIFPSKLSLSNP